MTDKLRAAAEAALEALDLVTVRFLDTEGSYGPYETEAIDAADAAIEQLRAALAEQQDAKPVAWMDRHGDLYKMPEIEGWAPPHTMLYAHPPRREWVSLTDEERLDAFDDYLARTSDGRRLFRHSWSYAEEEREAFDAGVAAAEAALKEKNT